MADENGVEEFDTIYPGWYAGRTPHFHEKVHVDGAASTTEKGGRVTRSGRLFFDGALSDQLFEINAHAGRDTSDRTLNDQDNLLDDHEAEPGFMLTLRSADSAALERGIIGTINLGFDPTATRSATGGGGDGGNGTSPGGGPGGPPEGSPPPD